MDAHEELGEKLAPGNADLLEIAVVGGVNDRYVCLVLAGARTLADVARLGIRRVDVDDEPLALVGIVDDVA